MELFIRSQDKNCLVKVDTCVIQVNIGFNDWDNYLFDVKSKTECNILCNKFYVGTYKTEKRAKQVLDEIEKFIQECYIGNRLNFIYQMPKD